MPADSSRFSSAGDAVDDEEVYAALPTFSLEEIEGRTRGGTYRSMACGVLDNESFEGADAAAFL